MSADKMDKEDFTFIKEEIVQKKKNEYKFLKTFATTLFLALVFGVVSAGTFCFVEPGIRKILYKEEPKDPITFPKEEPDSGLEGEDPDEEIPNGTDPDGNGQTPGGQDGVNPEDDPKEQVIIQMIPADLEDYVSMTNELRSTAYKSAKSIATISGSIKGRDLFGNPSETRIETSGLIIWQDEKRLYILTSYDRVSNAVDIKMKLTESESVEALLLDYETELNLAVLTVLIDKVPPLFMHNNILVAALGESNIISVGLPVIALGSPNGYPGSIEFGTISSKGSSAFITDNKLDLFNTSIRDYQEGDGVILNLKGEVIGIITRTLKQGLNRNLNTVIGISKLKPVIERMVNHEPRIYFGILSEDLTDQARKDHGVQYGIYINEVRANSPAFESGIRPGDIILQINETTIMNSSNFNSVISRFVPGQEVQVLLKRAVGSGNEEMSLKVILEKKVQ